MTNAATPEPTREFRRLWAAATSSLGDGAYLAAAPLLASALTEPVAVSLVTTSALAPWAFVSLFAELCTTAGHAVPS